MFCLFPCQFEDSILVGSHYKILSSKIMTAVDAIIIALAISNDESCKCAIVSKALIFGGIIMGNNLAILHANNSSHTNGHVISQACYKGSSL